jgi:periplasmic mercuric ion binding protein
MQNQNLLLTPYSLTLIFQTMNLSIKYITTMVLFLLFMTGFTSTTTAQKAVASTDQTVSFHVSGVCGDCKHRIESTALDVKGVKKAEWDQKSDMLVLVGSSKMDKQKVADALAKAGHGSDLAKADPNGYAKLPQCCQYDSVEKH